MLKSNLICSAICLASLPISAGAEAQASGDRAECMNEGDAFSLDAIINGCNNLIQSGKETPAKLAEAYCSRGIAYAKRREYDRAMADYDKAIDLDPKNAKALYQRGYVYDIKGERGGAHDPDQSHARYRSVRRVAVLLVGRPGRLHCMRVRPGGRPRLANI